MSAGRRSASASAARVVRRRTRCSSLARRVRALPGALGRLAAPSRARAPAVPRGLARAARADARAPPRGRVDHARRPPTGARLALRPAARRTRSSSRSRPRRRASPSPSPPRTRSRASASSARSAASRRCSRRRCSPPSRARSRSTSCSTRSPPRLAHRPRPLLRVDLGAVRDLPAPRRVRGHPGRPRGGRDGRRRDALRRLPARRAARGAPAIAVTALFAFMSAYNEFILAATLLGREEMFTLPVVLQRYIGEYDAAVGALRRRRPRRVAAGDGALLRRAAAPRRRAHVGRREGVARKLFSPRGDGERLRRA